MKWADSGPRSLQHLRGLEGGSAWLDSLPVRIERAVSRWDLRLGAPFADAYESMAFPAERSDGTQGVLKLHFPHRENAHEAAALAVWNGNGAVRLLDWDADLGALLLERCVPGTPLSAAPPEVALDALIELLPRLWAPPGAPFGSLADEAAHLAVNLDAEWERTGRPFERDLVDAALDAFTNLPPTQGEQVLLHQDLHGDNVLRAERQPWLAIDPKPLAGEREFSVAPIVRSSELGHRRRDVLRRFDRLTAELGLDRERARGWTIAHAVA